MIDQQAFKRFKHWLTDSRLIHSSRLYPARDTVEAIARSCNDPLVQAALRAALNELEGDHSGDRLLKWVTHTAKRAFDVGPESPDQKARRLFAVARRKELTEQEKLRLFEAQRTAGLPVGLPKKN